jgi:hypothetical protein
MRKARARRRSPRASSVLLTSLACRCRRRTWSRPAWPALWHCKVCHILCGNYATANALLDELVVLANEKGAFLWKAVGLIGQAEVLVLTGKAADAVQMLASGITARRSTGATEPWSLFCLARAYARNSVNSTMPGDLLAMR